MQCRAASPPDPHLPSIRGRSGGGGPPTAKVSGSSAAPLPPPRQPSISELQSIPSDGTPPTACFLIGSSLTMAPTLATTTRTPSLTLPALVTILSGLSSPTLISHTLRLSFPGTASVDSIRPT